jgi:single-stranded DNA-binding protein
MFNITLTGYLANDATKPEQHDVVNFRVGSQFWNGKENETIWTQCALWGNLGSKLLKYLVKGTPVTVTGELTEHSLQTAQQTGSQYISTKIKVTSIALHGSKAETNTATPVASQMAETNRATNDAQAKYTTVHDTTEDDDLPF